MTSNDRPPPSVNPYATPASDASALSHFSTMHQTSLIGKFGEACRLLSNHLVLFSAIILTVWLPGNLLINYLAYYVYSEDEIVDLMRSTMWIEGIFGPVYIGAMIHVLWKLKRGEYAGYSEAIGVGIRNWGRLFAARLVAGLIVTLGFLVLIIPGIVLQVRYALLDSAVVLDDADAHSARVRSTELTVGMRWQIFFAAILFFVPYMFLSVAIYLPVDFYPQLDTMATSVVLDCFLDIVYAIIQIVMFLFYWEAVAKETSSTGPAAGTTDAVVQ
ncbi:hypothetical protein TBK1r_30400 [Stieleria magnilauensis]|uniref:DUF7847 domain-containing protein n=2 Tax=Stieleria magnilauensis TaxID=2527963 RepID=A0ABX5XRT5_9BACT|nr:hypothetical protein TBK1r_30400 [Planctomycetes bacterium TBK1r]